VDAYALDQADRRLRLWRREEIDDALLALFAGACAGLVARFEVRLALALAIGAGLALALAAMAAARRRGLVASLALDRDAYVLEDVRHLGERLTTHPARERFARTFASLAADPERSPPCFSRSRVRAFAPELGLVADELRDPEMQVEPTSAAECRRLLTDGVVSPLLNPDVPVVDLRATLIRIEHGIHRAAVFPQPDQRSR
jgi:hypothetical protein